MSIKRSQTSILLRQVALKVEVLHDGREFIGMASLTEIVRIRSEWRKELLESGDGDDGRSIRGVARNLRWEGIDFDQSTLSQ